MKKLVLIGTVASSVYGFRKPFIEKLINRGYDVHVFISSYSNESELDKIYLMGAKVYVYRLKRGGVNIISDIKETIKLAKKLSQIKPDIVFSYFTKPVIFGTIASKIANVPYIIGMLEGLGFTFAVQKTRPKLKYKLIKYIQILLYKFSLPLLDKLILLNVDDKNDLLAKYNIKVKEVFILGGIGVDLKKYQYKECVVNNSISFLFIGRLLKEKGIYEFLEAARLVKYKYPETIFTILGSVDSENLGALNMEELDNFIISDIVNYEGQVSQVSKWIENHHIFVLPSYREGVPRSTQEAMAIGRAVITTNVPGCRETVIDGVNGFLVEPWNPQALAEKMIYFIEHPEDIRNMGNESYKIARNKFDENIVSERLVSILES